MPILSRDKKQLTYIYSASSHLGKQVLGYIQGIDKKIEVIDVDTTKLSDTIWVELSENLNTPLPNLFAIDNSDVKNNKDLKTNDWLKMINNNPELLQRPIAINGEKAMQITNRSEILKFFGVDSAGLEKTFGHEKPTTSSTTDDETFI